MKLQSDSEKTCGSPKVTGLPSFLARCSDLLGADSVHLEERVLSRLADNTLAKPVRPSAMVRPHSALHVQQIVKLAGMCGVSLHPISRGRNIGYGDRTPHTNGAVIMDLSRLNRIHEYDSKFGEVEIEPGVTQEQLYRYLVDAGNQHVADMTGAPLDASIIGNYLEGGFGHTPLGLRRQNIIDLELVLGTGETLRTGRMPSLGPDLSSLFIQSNFGIVTRMRIPLMPQPQSVATYTLDFSDLDSLYNGIDRLRRLRSEGVFQSLIHLGNATRVYMSRSRFPSNMEASRVLSDEECRDMMRNFLIKPGLWSAVGALYGTPDQIAVNQKILSENLGGVAKVRHFGESRIKTLQKVCQTVLCLAPRLQGDIKKSLHTLESIHNLSKGIPTQQPTENIQWRTNSLDDLGLIWVCPALPADGENLRSLIGESSVLFKKFGFEMPLTVTLVDARSLIAVFSINFNRKNDQEIVRAHQLQEELQTAIKKLGLTLYRTGVGEISSLWLDPEKKATLERIKGALDPDHIISPERYGIK